MYKHSDSCDYPVYTHLYLDYYISYPRDTNYYINTYKSILRSIQRFLYQQ